MQDLEYEVREFLRHRIDDPSRVVLAFSGGLDSCVLLRVLQRVVPANRLLAWHIHHGLLECADAMASFCKKFTADNQIDFRVSHLKLDSTQSNLEAIARQARYAEFEKGLSDTDFLITAHHADDQIETLFLNLIRGSGSAGLRGIAPVRQLKKFTVLRPLLDISRDTIKNYAQQHAIEWFEDPSNRDSRFDRNFIRLQIIPVLKNRWPGLWKSIGRVIRIQEENLQILDEVGEEDYQRCCISPLQLNKKALLQLSQIRQKNVVRYWLRENRVNSIPNGRLESLIRQLQSRQHTVPKIQGKGYDIRIYDAKVFIVKPDDSDMPDVSREEILSYLNIKDKGQKILLGFRNRELPPAEEKHRLKRLFQNHRIPPWLRDRTPLIFVDGVLKDLYILPVDDVDK